ncbi:MAG: tetratricopeptide repeat protein [Planctomycetes bacterium]|nr:tetratricopeptide repeat protein [Planctomycetota bacterium]MCC7170952.1 tetratricopeptide repeat protein [Planctomycetota bacterium]
MFWVRCGLGRSLLLSLLGVGVAACSRADDAAASSTTGADDSRLLEAPAFQRVKSKVESLERRVATLEQDADARVELAKAYLQGGMRARAEQHLRAALELDADLVEARMILIDLAMASGDVATARTLIDAGLARKVSAALLVADARARLLADPAHARDEALRVLERALELKPDHLDANYEAATLLLDAGDAAAAAAKLERVVSASPIHLGAQFKLARAYRALGRIDDAARVASTHRRLGRLDDLGMLSQADTPEASLALADVLADGGDRAGARAELTAAAVRFPEHPQIRVRYAAACVADGDAAAAKAGFESALLRLPDDSRIQADYARFLATGPEATRDAARAVALARAAVETTSGADADVIEVLAEAYAAYGDRARAIAALREAERIAPKRAALARRRAELERDQGGPP